MEKKTMSSYYKSNMKLSQEKVIGLKSLRNKALNDYTSQEDLIRNERNRQAHWKSALKAIFYGANSILIIYGGVLLLNGQTSEGAYVAVVGIGSSTITRTWRQFSRDANEPLDKTTTKESENQLNKWSHELNCLPDSEAQDSETDSSEEANEDTLTAAIEKIDQVIRSDARNR